MSDIKSRVVVAVSGTGRSLENLLRREKDFAYSIVGVISSRADCLGVEIARSHGLPILVHKFPAEPDSVTTTIVYDWLTAQSADWLALAGFIRKFPIVPAWEGRIINIHPALLPKYGGRGMYGDRVHAAVLAAKDAQSGATLHFVNDQYDEGPIVAQECVPVLPDDSVESLRQRVFAAETILYPRGLDELVRGTKR